MSIFMVFIVTCFFVGLILWGVIILSKGKKDEGFATLFITVGVKLVATSFGTFYDKLKEIMIILKDSQNVEQSLKVTKEISAVNYPQLLVGVVLTVLGIFFLRYIKQRLYILNINGYFSNRIEEHFKSLKLSQFEFKEREIDFISEQKIEMNAEKAKDIEQLIERKVKSFREESKNYQRGYTGIAQIPFVAIAGTYLKRTQLDQYYEYDKKEKETYYRLRKSNQFPQLKDITNYNQIDKGVQEVVLAVSITTPILDSQLIQFTNCQVIRLTIEKPKDNTIQSQKQLFEYKNTIIHVIEYLPKIFTNLKKIHLVCSSQSCLPLEIGKNIEDYRNAQIICYHFDAQSEKKYPWGIVVNGTDKGKFIEG